VHRPEVTVAKRPAHDRAVSGVGDPVELDEVDVVGGALVDELPASRPSGHRRRRDQVAPAGQQGGHGHHEHAPPHLACLQARQPADVGRTVVCFDACLQVLVPGRVPVLRSSLIGVASRPGPIQCATDLTKHH
jgi:hypothetical protein